jgi:hypothetical protein
MNTNIFMRRWLAPVIAASGFLAGATPVIVLMLCAACALGSLCRTANAQIFVADIDNSGGPQNLHGSIGEYNLDGTVVNRSLISGLYGPNGIVISGTSLFVANAGGSLLGSVGEYSTSGAAIHPMLIPSISPAAIALSGSTLFASHNAFIGKYATDGTTITEPLISSDSTNFFGLALSGDGTRLYAAGFDDGTIGEYEAATGAPISAALITGLGEPTGITISGEFLYVANSAGGVTGAGSIGKYHLDGSPVDAALVTGLSNPQDVAEFNGVLYVTDNGRVGEYDATTGAAISPNLITGFIYPTGIAVVPEPASWLLCALAAAGLIAVRQHCGAR